MLYYILSTIFFLLLALVWNAKSWPNLFIKLALFLMVGFGFFMILKDAGFMISAPAGARWF